METLKCMMKRAIGVVLLCVAVVVVACSPYAIQARRLNDMYLRGEITADQYSARLNELMALDLQWRRNASQALSNFANYWQRQPEPPAPANDVANEST